MKVSGWPWKTKRRLALGQESIASLDELDEEEETIVSNESTDAPTEDPALIPTNEDANKTELAPSTCTRQRNSRYRRCKT